MNVTSDHKIFDNTVYAYINMAQKKKKKENEVFSGNNIKTIVKSCY